MVQCEKWIKQEKPVKIRKKLFKKNQTKTKKKNLKKERKNRNKLFQMFNLKTKKLIKKSSNGIVYPPLGPYNDIFFTTVSFPYIYF